MRISPDRRSSRPALLQPASSERGAALLIVIGVGLLLLTLVSTAMTFSVSGAVKANTDQNWNGAMAAAYAGVEEYESRLANDNAYYRYGNSGAAFSAGSTLVAPAVPNPAFGVGAAGGWASVAGSGALASYRYEVDSSAYAGSGVLRIRSTGRVGNSTRSIVANIKQQGFIDYLYFTVYEIEDPEQSHSPAACADKYAWAGRPNTSCSEIAFGSGDVLNGPVHSNDTIRICQATFKGKVTTGNSPVSGLNYLQQNSLDHPCTGQVFERGVPKSSSVLGMPATNSQLKQETRTDAGIDNPGCLYTGATRIVLDASGTMTIRSPWTKKTRVTGDPATAGSTPAACGLPGTGTGQLGSAGGATVPVLDANLLFVQDVPINATDPNFTNGTTWPSGNSASSCNNGNGVGFPLTDENSDGRQPKYRCRTGDAFVQGSLRGTMTIATENSIYVTGDIIYTDASVDVLGLVSQSTLWIWNPVSTSGKILPSNRRIDAAMLSLEHSVQVQNFYRGGSQGTLTINGSLAQKYRGIVARNGHGYVKNYNYDPRFRYLSPPKFLSPVSATYRVNLLVEVSKAFTVDGALVP